MKQRPILAIVLVLALVLSLAACTASQNAGTETAATPTEEAATGADVETTAAAASETEAPTEATEAETTEAETSEAAEETPLENGGCKLRVPGEFVNLVEITTDDPEGNGTLFSVSEKASLEAAEKLHPENTDGAGWLFSVRKVDEAGYIDTITMDMSGTTVIGKDESGNYYLLGTPTDVRVEREDMSTFTPESEDFQQWSALCAWAASIPATFCADNGLTAIEMTNTDVDILLNRLAYLGMDDAYFATLDYGELPLDDDNSHLLKLLDGVKFEWLEYAEDEESLTQTPDGEYYCLYLPGEDVRMDFFKGDETMVRVVREGNVQLYRASYADESKTTTAVVAEWLQALADAA